VFPVSALHSRGFDDLMDAVLPHLPPAGEAAAAAPPLVVTIAGRPNAGKSSFVNRLLQRDRVVVSSVPGTTRDSIEIPFSIGVGPQARNYVLIDTAGMRASRRIDSAVEKFSLIRVEEAIARSDLVVLTIDAIEGPSRQDKRIAELILSGHKGCLLVVNKWDLIAARRPSGMSPTRQMEEYRAAVRREVPFLDFAPMCFISAKTGQGVGRTIEAFDHVASQISMAFTTGVLNRALQDAVTRQSPPALGGRRLKLYYAAQTGIRPVRLKMFVNSPDLVAPTYRRYLERRLREKFGLDGAPVVFHFVPRRREA
jgi:GTP-binding protein